MEKGQGLQYRISQLALLPGKKKKKKANQLWDFAQISVRISNLSFKDNLGGFKQIVSQASKIKL